MSRELSDVLRCWSSEELRNLAFLLKLEQASDVDEIMQEMKWLYHSKVRAGTEGRLRNAVGKLLAKVSSRYHRPSRPEDLRPVPSYDELVIAACKRLKAFEDGASIPKLELYLTHAVIVASLQHMTPKDRCKFFEQQIGPSEIAAHANIRGADLRGPARAGAALLAAQASGFGVYQASTTALGLLTHAVGVTLPFTVYTGMSSTIAFLIGPAGWLGAGLWGAWKLTEPNWKRLVPALVCIVATNSRRREFGG